MQYRLSREIFSRGAPPPGRNASTSANLAKGPPDALKGPMQRTIECAIFQNPSEMAEAIEVLLRHGFGSGRLSMLLFPARAATGASIGRSRVRWPLSVRALALPGVGPLVAAGPIAESL